MDISIGVSNVQSKRIIKLSLKLYPFQPFVLVFVPFSFCHPLFGAVIFFWIFHCCWVGPYFLVSLDWGGKESSKNIALMAIWFFFLYNGGNSFSLVFKLYGNMNLLKVNAWLQRKLESYSNLAIEFDFYKTYLH